MSERRGRPWVAVLLFVFAVVLGVCAAVVGADWSGLAGAFGNMCYPASSCYQGSIEGAIVLGVLAAACFVGGMVVSVRIAKGGRAAASDHAIARRPRRRALVQPPGRPPRPPFKRRRGGGRR